MKTLLLFALMGVVLPAHADAYKCLDAGGRTIYQEKPCETANLKAVGKVAKPVGEPSQEAIDKLQADVKASKQRDADRMKAEQDAAQKETGQPKTDQPAERRNGAQY